ncbi:MAG: ABC transporter ATP-binding protein [Caldicoprobacterales bacterium]|jgi:ABC-type multidrug transport system fused ATPase/permease subunit|nr:ABC transporter ATP-binding protein [Clostridiales bacterium]
MHITTANTDDTDNSVQTTGMTGVRKNLAIELLDKQVRKQYLHTEKHGLFDILKVMYRPVLKNRKIVAASVAYALTDGVLPLLSISIVHILVQLLTQQNATPQRFITAAGIYALIFFVCSSLSSQLKHRNYSYFMNLRMTNLNRAMQQFMVMDYGLFENASFLDDVGNWDRSLQSNNRGLEGAYHRIFEMGGTFVSVLLLGGLLALVSPWIALVGLVFITVFYLVQKNITIYQHNRREELQKVRRRTDRFTSESSDFRYGKDMRLFQMEERFRQTFRPLLAAYEKLYKAFTRRELQLSFLESAALVLIDIVSFFALIAGVHAGKIFMAEFVMLLTAVTLFTQTVQLFAQGLAFVKSETLYYGDTIDFMEADLVSTGGDGEIPGDGPVTVEFRNVSFCYPGTEALVLENLNLTIKAGEKCALVGVNGAGKTTMVKLITGLYQPTEGKILINGVDAATIPQEQLYSLFGVVFQEVQPLALTIAENVAAADTDIDRDRVVENLKKAGLWEKVSSLPKGIDSPMLKVIEEDGVVLSGGENQKLAIARALYREGARMMIMDEPTAALDALAEERIYREFDAILSGKTALFISHRLASTRFCDRIILLNGGRIAQQGTHDELMEEEGLYRTMFLTQGKYYQDKNEEVTV